MNDLQGLSEAELREKLLILAEQLGLMPVQQWASPKFQLPADDLDLVCLQLAEQPYGLYLPAVKEVIHLVKLTPLPGVSPVIVGLLNLRRKIVPVIDLRLLLGFPFRAYDENTPIILIEDKEQMCGVIVDAVSEVIKLPNSVVKPATGNITHSDYILALAQTQTSLIMVLDHTKLLKVVSEHEWDRLLTA